MRRSLSPLSGVFDFLDMHLDFSIVKIGSKNRDSRISFSGSTTTSRLPDSGLALSTVLLFSNHIENADGRISFYRLDDDFIIHVTG